MDTKSDEGTRNRCCCEQPEKLKGTPAECTPEQIEECHGEHAEKGHSCCGDSE